MVSKSSRIEPRTGSPASEETILVGRVGRAHGLRGEVRVEIWSDVPERFAIGSELLLTGPAADGRRRVRITGLRWVKGGAIVRFAGTEARDDAEALRGSLLGIERTEVPRAPEGTYYHFELIGCSCFDARHGELGKVVDLVDHGGGTLLRVENGASSLLVPFVEAFLDRVDPAAGRIDLRLPEGLVETCASTS